MEAKHTPGPWTTNGYSSPLTGLITVYSRPFGLGDIAEVHDINDARLIAAAPALLSALDRLQYSYRLLASGKPVRDMAETLGEVDAAIAKATQP